MLGISESITLEAHWIPQINCPKFGVESMKTSLNKLDLEIQKLRDESVETFFALTNNEISPGKAARRRDAIQKKLLNVQELKNSLLSKTIEKSTSRG